MVVLLLEGVTFELDVLLAELELEVELELDLELEVEVLVAVLVEVLLVFEDEVDVEVDVELLELEVELGVGVGVEEVLELRLPAFSNTLILAFPPGGTVTTQNLPPPAPAPPLEPVTSLTPFSAGSILQGRPLQPPPSHSISTP